MSSLELAAAASGNNLPCDIMESILHLLPSKSLGRFKSVSKEFNSLISGPRFIEAHLHQNQEHQMSKLIIISEEQPHLLYSVDVAQLLRCLTYHPTGIESLSNNELYTCVNNNNTDHTLYSRDQLITELFRRFDNDFDDLPATELGIPAPLIMHDLILGSCNGLVLMQPKYMKLAVTNPTTRERWNVPPSPFLELERPSFLLYGFCYLPSADDYNIVVLSYWDILYGGSEPDCTDTLLSVYSLRSNSWRMLPSFPIHHSTYIYHVVMNQSFYWLAQDSKIRAFNIATEEFDELRLPDSIANQESYECKLMVVGGKLGVTGVGEENELLVMEEYGVTESWIRVCSLGDCIRFSDSKNTLCLGSRWIPLDTCDDGGKVVVYDMDEGKRRKVRIVGGPRRFNAGGVYVETLESPKRIITPP